MGISVFVDKQHQPTSEEIEAVLGPAFTAWQALAAHAFETYRAVVDWGYYGINYGWAWRFRKNGKALLSLYASQDRFTIQVVVPEPVVQGLLAAGAPEAIRQAIERAAPYAEGRWLFIPAQSLADLPAIQHLLRLKMTPPRRRDLAA